MPVFDAALMPPDAPLSPLARALVSVSLELARHFGQPYLTIKDPAELTGAEELQVMRKRPATSSPAFTAGHRRLLGRKP